MKRNNVTRSFKIPRNHVTDAGTQLVLRKGHPHLHLVNDQH